MKFKIGDVVKLKSGGQRMVIISIKDDGYECVFGRERQVYPEAAICLAMAEKIEPEFVF
jgi:uncharacterized protein YodC (DUF2158 family)